MQVVADVLAPAVFPIVEVIGVRPGPPRARIGELHLDLHVPSDGLEGAREAVAEEPLGLGRGVDVGALTVAAMSAIERFGWPEPYKAAGAAAALMLALGTAG